MNNSNTFFYTYCLKVLWHRKSLFAIAHSSSSLHSSCATSIETEDTNNCKNYEEEPTKFNQTLDFQEYQVEQLLNLL